MQIKDPTVHHHYQPHHLPSSPKIYKQLKKNSSQPQIQDYSVRQTGEASSKITKVDSNESKRMRKSSSTGPNRQFKFEQPVPVAEPDPIATSMDVLKEMDYDDKPLITEEEEHEIRQVASDINEKAFYGKILKTKHALEKENEFKKLSPRS